jgi:hypothetical protein
MVLNATFNHIFITSWRSILLVEETGIRENNRPPHIIYKFITQCCTLSTIALTPIMRVTYNVEGYGDSFDAPDPFLDYFFMCCVGRAFVILLKFCSLIN